MEVLFSKRPGSSHNPVRSTVGHCDNWTHKNGAFEAYNLLARLETAVPRLQSVEPIRFEGPNVGALRHGDAVFDCCSVQNPTSNPSRVPLESNLPVYNTGA